ncbi:unnamed protein product [Parajaminaea phylloscopi]
MITTGQSLSRPAAASAVAAFVAVPVAFRQRQTAGRLHTGTETTSPCRRNSPCHRIPPTFVLQSSDILETSQSSPSTPSDVEATGVPHSPGCTTRSLHLYIDLANGHILSPDTDALKMDGSAYRRSDYGDNINWHPSRAIEATLRNSRQMPTDVGYSDDEYEYDDHRSGSGLTTATPMQFHLPRSTGIGDSPSYRTHLPNAAAFDSLSFRGSKAGQSPTTRYGSLNYSKQTDIRSVLAAYPRPPPLDFPETPLTASVPHFNEMSLLGRDAAALLKELEADSVSPETIRTETTPFSSSADDSSPTPDQGVFSAKLRDLQLQLQGTHIREDPRQLTGPRGLSRFVPESPRDDAVASSSFRDGQTTTDQSGSAAGNSSQSRSTAGSSGSSPVPEAGGRNGGGGFSTLRERRLLSHRRSTSTGSGPPPDLPDINTNIRIEDRPIYRTKTRGRRESLRQARPPKHVTSSSQSNPNPRHSQLKEPTDWHAKVRAWKAYSEAVGNEGQPMPPNFAAVQRPTGGGPSPQQPGQIGSVSRAAVADHRIPQKVASMSSVPKSIMAPADRASTFSMHAPVNHKVESNRRMDQTEDSAGGRLQAIPKGLSRASSSAASAQSAHAGRNSSTVHAYNYTAALSARDEVNRGKAAVPPGRGQGHTPSAIHFQQCPSPQRSKGTSRHRPSSSPVTASTPSDAHSPSHRGHTKLGEHLSALQSPQSSKASNSLYLHPEVAATSALSAGQRSTDAPSVTFSVANTLKEGDVELSEERLLEEAISLSAVRRRLVSAFPDLGFSNLRGALPLTSRKGTSTAGSALDGDMSDWNRLNSERSMRKVEERNEAREADITVEIKSRQEEVSVQINIYTEQRQGGWEVLGAAPPGAPLSTRLPTVADVWSIPIDSKGIVARQKLKSNIEMASTRTVVECAECAKTREKGMAVLCHLCKGRNRVEKVYVVTVTIRLASFLPLKLPSIHLLGTPLTSVKYVEGQTDAAAKTEVLREKALEGTLRAAQRVGQEHASRHRARLLMAKAHIKRRGMTTVTARTSRSSRRRLFNVIDCGGKITEVQNRPSSSSMRSLKSNFSFDSMAIMSFKEASGTGNIFGQPAFAQSRSTIASMELPRTNGGSRSFGATLPVAGNSSRPLGGGGNGGGGEPDSDVASARLRARGDRSESVTPRPRRHVPSDYGGRRSPSPTGLAGNRGGHRGDDTGRDRSGGPAGAAAEQKASSKKKSSSSNAGGLRGLFRR